MALAAFVRRELLGELIAGVNGTDRSTVIDSGGGGNDILNGGTGDDTYLFDTDTPLGTDTIDESSGGIETFDFSATTTHGNALNNNLRGGAGNDVLIGNDGNDMLDGEDDVDTLLGGDGNDTLVGSGADSLDGGTGQDGVVFYGTSGNDHITIARGNGPFVIFTLNGQTTTLPYSNGETVFVFAGDGNDHVVMDASAGIRWHADFHGEGGNDQLFGSIQDDTLDGGDGNNDLSGGGGNDLLINGRQRKR